MYSDITMATKKQSVAIRVAPELVQELDKIGKRVNRSRAWVGEEALRQYVEVQRWQLAEIATGIEDVKSGRVVSNDAMAEWLKSWGKPDEKPAPGA